MKNILITGGAGFIGSRLCEKLYDKGYNITVLDNLSQQIHGETESSLFKSEPYIGIESSPNEVLATWISIFGKYERAWASTTSGSISKLRIT